MRRFSIPAIAVVCAVWLSSSIGADTSVPFSISSFGTFVEDFDTLAPTNISPNTPTGWGFLEAGTNANTTYTAGTGSGNSGDTYSFGTAGSTERALGSLLSGSVTPTLGAQFKNETGGTVTSLTITYTGEQWRLGALFSSGTTPRGPDRLDFQYSTNATSLAAGTYVDVNALDFVSPVTGPTVGALNGNAAANRTTLTATISGLSIPNGGTFWIRWLDFNVANSDDGLAIDDFSMTVDGVVTPGDDAPVVTGSAPANGASGVPVASNIVINFSESVVAPGTAFSLDCGGPRSFVLSGSPSGSLTLDPNGDLPYGTSCTVTVTASAVSDEDTDDPPDTLASNAAFTFTTEAPPVTSDIVISQFYAGGGNNSALYQNDYVELYNRGSVTVDTAGWTLQYASATGSGWDFNKTVLGGPIAPGEYYLVKLASGGANGAALPPENVSGPINMAAGQGKLALVASFAALTGNCPVAHPSVKDFVGWGTADCSEGLTKAPSGSNTTALFRQGGGATDTNTNGSDFVTGVPSPRRTAPFSELGPVLLSTDPPSNGFNVPRDPTIVLTFTEPVEVAEPFINISCTVSGSHNSYTLAGSGRFIDITPNVNMVAGEQCTVTVTGSQVHDQDLDDSGPSTDTLLADHSWSFTVASGTAPPFPSAVHLTFGNPTNATADLGQPHNYLMEKPEFTLSYNRDLGRPNWVSWHLSSEWFGTLTRVDTFRADPQVPPDWYRVQGFDFSGSGFDRGHMVPNADRDKETSIPINQATFLMTNMIAQAGGNNQGPWADMEAALREVAGEDHELFIVSGPEGVGGVGDFGLATTIANGRVTVPATTWKVALVLPKLGGDDVSRVTCATRTIAAIMPNVESIAGQDWQEFLTSVDAVETLTGYDLFSNLPDNIEYCVEAGINGNNPPEDVLPPVITCAEADGSWHGGNVSLACTASDPDSGLGSAADANFTLTTSVGDGVEDANAATGSRVVCDAVGNCATAGPITGNMIDRKAPSIAIATPANGSSYQLNSSVIASFSCSDAGSGIGSCTGTVANGASIDTASAGAKSFVVSATDATGNTTSVTVNYSVLTAVESLEGIASDLRAIIAASTRAPLTARANNALRKVEDAIAELSETPPDTHHARISIGQAMQQIEGLRNQGLLPASTANALLAQLAGVSY
ncbi:MAG TPA: DNA/RNA non-specific endonuclease [Vicinamibacterales bacterium]|nr:DNA/RNA non-specific endonuclease [Vicinamibacterales bacterium]